MDSNVQTKTPNSRRTKYVIIGLIAVICVLSFQLYKENKIKKQLVSRKSFLINKLYECRVASEKTETKYKDKRAQSEQLMKALAAKQESYELMSTKYNDLETSLQSRTEELSSLQQSAADNKNELSTLKENYDSAMSSVKTMQGKLDDTMRVCDKHKEISRSLNMSATERVRQLEVCKREKASLEQEKASLEQEKEALITGQQILRNKVQEMRKSAVSTNDQTGGSNVQQPQQPSVVQSQPPIAGKVKYTEQVHSQSTQNAALPAQSSQTSLPQSIVTNTPPKEVIQVTPSVKQPMAQQTGETLPPRRQRRAKRLF